MATLEERIQNLTQEVNPPPRRLTEREIMEMRKTNPMAGMLGSPMGMYQDDVMPVGTGVMSDQDAQRVMDATPELSGSMASSPMQPLVDLGFGEQVNIILSNPADSQISRDAQQVIINELGTGMDIDGFLMEVRKLAPKGAMSDMDSQGINELLKFGVEQVVDKTNTPLLKLGVETGRMNDTTIGHLSEGEAVIPAEVLEANPSAAQSLDETMMQMGIDPDSRIVDTTGEITGIASINPETGLQEFGIGSAFQKLRRKVLKPVAKVAAVIPGPWQAPAIIYNKAEAGYNIAKGEGGISDLMTVMAGGSQKIRGEGGALERVMSGDFIKEGGGTSFFDSANKALRNIGTVDGKFAPLQYGRNIAETFRDDQVGGYFGLLGGGEQEYVIQKGDTLNAIAEKTGMDVNELAELNNISNKDQIFVGNKLKIPTKGTNPFIKSIGDRIGLGGRSGLEDAYGVGAGGSGGSGGSRGSGSGQGGMGMGGKFALAGLAGLLGKLAYEEQKKQKGVPLTPLTTMDALGRYNIASEIARRTGEEMPSRVEFGLTAEGMPALTGGRPTVAESMVFQPPEKRMMAGGGIMAFAQGGAVAMQEGGEPPIDMADFPRKNGEIDGPGTGTSDDIPAMLSDGEFVMTAKAVRNAGSYDMSSNNGIVTLSPNGGSDREAGTRIMYKLMNHFENLA